MGRPLSLSITRAAEADLAQAWSFLVLKSGAAEAFATEYVARITRRFSLATEMPLLGAPREELAAGLRVIFHYPYAVYCQVVGETVVIIRVLHGARDAAAILGGD